MKTAYEWMMSIPADTPLTELRTEIEKMAARCIADTIEACAKVAEEKMKRLGATYRQPVIDAISALAPGAAKGDGE